MQIKKTYILVRAKILGITQTIFLLFLFVGILIRNDQIVTGILIKMAIVEMFLFGILFYYRIIQPIKKMNRIFMAFAEGYTMQDIFIQRFEFNKAH